MSDLIARLRHGSVCVEIEDDQTMNEAADALEAKDRRIAELEKGCRDDADFLLIAHMDGYHTAKKECRARIAELEAENAKFRAMYDEQLLMAVKVSAVVEKKDDDTMSDDEWKQVSQLSKIT